MQTSPEDGQSAARGIELSPPSLPFGPRGCDATATGAFTAGLALPAVAAAHESSTPRDIGADGSEAADTHDADLERRFGGLRRLYGDEGYRRLRALRVAVVGVGGVGSWAAEALARCGVHTLVLIDLDHVAVSNINRQVQAVGHTLGKAKVQALRERIADIHPGCQVHAVEEFAEPANWPALLPCPVDAVIDACDQSRAKQALAAWALRGRHRCVVAGAAGGKRLGHRVELADLADVTHDPLLAGLRQRLRRDGAAPRQGRIGLTCVFSREPVQGPAGEGTCASDGSLNCAGYGSVVTVTAAFGLAAAGAVIEQATSRA